MEIYPIGSRNYFLPNILYDSDSEGGSSGSGEPNKRYTSKGIEPTVLGRTLSASWSRGLAERLEEAKKRPMYLRRGEHVGGCNPNVFKKPRRKVTPTIK